MRSKWLVGALVGSLVLNLLLAGFIVGRLTSGSPFPAFRPDPTMGVHRLIDFVPEPRRQELQATLRRQVRAMLPELRRMRGSHRRIEQALTAEPFDAAELERTLADLRGQLEATQVASHAAFIEIAAAMTPEERAQLVREMRRPFRHRSRDPSRDSSHRESSSRDRPPPPT